MVTKLPRLFDIFSPSTCRKPLCIQTLAIRVEPKAQQDCAISFSWWGKTRSIAAAMNVEHVAGSGRRRRGRRRRARAASPSTSPSIRCASRGGPARRSRQGSASSARSASTASTARNPSGRACKARRRRARPPASRRASDARARHSAARRAARPSPRARTARDPRRHRRRRGRSSRSIIARIFSICCSGARLEGRRQGAQRRDVFVELALGRLRHLGDRVVERQVRPVALGARVDLVVDVGDVADVDHMLGAVDMAQQAEQHVEHDHRPGVADMGEVVDGRAADIEPHRARVDRREILLPAGQRVVEKRHASLQQSSRVWASGSTRRVIYGASRVAGTGRMIASRRRFRNRDANQPA